MLPTQVFKQAHIYPVVYLSCGFGLQIFFKQSASLGHLWLKLDNLELSSSRSKVRVGTSLQSSADGFRIAHQSKVKPRLNAYVLAFGKSPELQPLLLSKSIYSGAKKNTVLLSNCSVIFYIGVTYCGNDATFINFSYPFLDFTIFAGLISPTCQSLSWNSLQPQSILYMMQKSWISWKQFCWVFLVLISISRVNSNFSQVNQVLQNVTAISVSAGHSQHIKNFWILVLSQLQGRRRDYLFMVTAFLYRAYHSMNSSTRTMGLCHVISSLLNQFFRLTYLKRKWLTLTYYLDALVPMTLVGSKFVLEISPNQKSSYKVKNLPQTFKAVLKPRIYHRVFKNGKIFRKS